MTQPIRTFWRGLKGTKKLDSGLSTTVGDWNQTNAFSISKKYAKINTEQTLPCASNFSQMSVVIENYFSVRSGPGHPWVQLECCHSADIKEFHIKRRKKSFSLQFYTDRWGNFLKWLKFMLISHRENNMKRKFQPIKFELKSSAC